MAKKIEMIFYQTTPSEENKGLKFVLWEVSEINFGPTLNPNRKVTHDWGFAMWDGREWEEIEVPQGYTATVHSWSNTCDPKLLLNEPSKIVRFK